MKPDQVQKLLKVGANHGDARLLARQLQSHFCSGAVPSSDHSFISAGVRDSESQVRDAGDFASTVTVCDTSDCSSDALARLFSPATARFLLSRPADWASCLRLARDKFETYFRHKALRLLEAFPSDAKLADGSPFWQLPKRRPTPIVFDHAQPDHVGFVISFARLLSDQLGIRPPKPPHQLQKEDVLEVLRTHTPPAYRPTPGRKFVTDESLPRHTQLEGATTSSQTEVAAANPVCDLDGLRKMVETFALNVEDPVKKQTPGDPTRYRFQFGVNFVVLGT
ncbi:unnamed protein product [Protopolystoma xenopodis]|uniref:Ubiquitin-activating enzyme SCCH domain-containing protein n=1 Tax=Protopolystoma xenopodis TaxID=117903 RepID=A0A3S5FG78_9PLAT|nr:unnamed protein product [Protopolystoma xenopodis]